MWLRSFGVCVADLTGLTRQPQRRDTDTEDFHWEMFKMDMIWPADMNDRVFAFLLRVIFRLTTISVGICTHLVRPHKHTYIGIDPVLQMIFLDDFW